jgi:hypothetical protein
MAQVHRLAQAKEFGLDGHGLGLLRSTDIHASVGARVSTAPLLVDTRLGAHKRSYT